MALLGMASALRISTRRAFCVRSSCAVAALPIALAAAPNAAVAGPPAASMKDLIGRDFASENKETRVKPLPEPNEAEKKLQQLVAEAVAQKEKDLGFKFDKDDIAETEKILRNKCALIALAVKVPPALCLSVVCLPLLAFLPKSELMRLRARSSSYRYCGKAGLFSSMEGGTCREDVITAAYCSNDPRFSSSNGCE